MRRCDRILIVYDYYGVTLQQLRDAFRYVAKHKIPQGEFPYYQERILVDTDNEKCRHIQVQYDGRPFINARSSFSEANRTVHRFLFTSGLTDIKISCDSTNQFND